jgi:hypothetical protein
MIADCFSKRIRVSFTIDGPRRKAPAVRRYASKLRQYRKTDEAQSAEHERQGDLPATADEMMPLATSRRRLET